MKDHTLDPSAHPDLSSSEADLVRQIAAFTQKYFQNPKFDASHDFTHVMRVVRNSIRILEQEKQLRASQTPALPKLDTTTVILGALLHDVGDKKYIDASQPDMPLAKQELIRLGMSEQQADIIQSVVDGVSYSSEIKDPQKVKDLITRVPELAIVQDSDRLDAIGAIGVGRCFTFGGARSVRSLGNSIDHFDDKLLKLEGMMKTDTGKKLAAERSDRIRDFMAWWKDETEFSGLA